MDCLEVVKSLGMFDQRSLYNLYVYQEAQILPRRCRCDLRGDHLTFKKFLAKNTLNSKVNNWAIKFHLFELLSNTSKESNYFGRYNE